MVEEDNEAVENIDVVNVETDATTRKRKATPARWRGPKWMSLEDESLTDAWKSVSSHHRCQPNFLQILQEKIGSIQ
jgi:hypothetical protein